MIAFDFKATAERLRALVREAEGLPHEQVMHEAAWSTEQELASQAVLFLYDHMVKRDQYVAAAQLLAHATPNCIRQDPRIVRAVHHAHVAAVGKFETYERELIEARVGTLRVSDDLARASTMLTPRARYWLSVVRLTRAETALEYGCGAGLNVMQCAQLEPAVRWYGGDVNREQVEICNNQARAIGLSFDRTSFATVPTDQLHGRADCVAVLDTLEHTAYPDRVLDEAERCLRPNGVIVLSVPTWRGSARIGTDAGLDVDDVEMPAPSHVNTTTFPDLVAYAAKRGRILDAARLPQTCVADAEGAVVTYQPSPR